MEFAITLVAPPGSGGLLELSRSVSAMLGHKAEPVWLAEGEAVDLVFEGQADRQTRPALKERIGEKVRSLPVDWCLQPARHRRKRMLIADMDSTIIGQECLDEMAD